ncbi:protease FtsH-inhibitory lysogeny factor CIII [Escherichia coli O10]
MIYAIAGGARMGAFQLNESLLERITRKLRDGWKRVEVLLCAMNSHQSPDASCSTKQSSNSQIYW